MHEFYKKSIDSLRICYNYKKMLLIYGIILIITSLYFITGFPIPFLDIYHNASSITLFLLLLVVSSSILIKSRRSLSSMIDNVMIVLIGIALAEASFMLLFYYWAVSISYVSPSQNLLIIPIMQDLMSWMYNMIL